MYFTGEMRIRAQKIPDLLKIVGRQDSERLTLTKAFGFIGPFVSSNGVSANTQNHYMKKYIILNLIHPTA